MDIINANFSRACPLSSTTKYRIRSIVYEVLRRGCGLAESQAVNWAVRYIATDTKSERSQWDEERGTRTDIRHCFGELDLK